MITLTQIRMYAHTSAAYEYVHYDDPRMVTNRAVIVITSTYPRDRKLFAAHIANAQARMRDLQAKWDAALIAHHAKPLPPSGKAHKFDDNDYRYERGELRHEIEHYTNAAAYLERKLDDSCRVLGIQRAEIAFADDHVADTGKMVEHIDGSNNMVKERAA